MIDIAHDPRWGRCIEGFGEDPYLTSKMGQAVIHGFQGEDNKKTSSVAACAKHYLGYGAVEGGRDYGKAEISDYTLRNYYLKPFKAAIEADVATVVELKGNHGVTAVKVMFVSAYYGKITVKYAQNGILTDLISFAEYEVNGKTERYERKNGTEGESKTLRYMCIIVPGN